MTRRLPPNRTPHPLPTLAGCLALALTSLPAHAQQSARNLEKQAFEAAEREDFQTAARDFDAAAQAAERERLDPAVARYNQALALVRAAQAHDAAQADEAADRFKESLQTEDLRLQQLAYYNRGNARFQQGMQQAENQQDLQSALDTLNDAAGMFKEAIILDPSDPDARRNYEITWKRIEEVESLLQDQEEQDQQEQDQQEQDQQEQDQQGQDPQDEDQQDQDQDQDQDSQQDEQQQEQEQQDQQQQQQDQPQQDQQQDAEDSEEPGESEAPPDGDGSETTPPSAPPPGPAEEMTQEEAEMILNAIREEERAGREQIRLRYGSAVPVEKDW